MYGIDAHICYDAFERAHREHMESQQYFSFLSALSLRSFFYKNIPCELKQDDMITRICFPNDITRDTISKLNNELHINVIWEDLMHSILSKTGVNDCVITGVISRNTVQNRRHSLFDTLKRASKLVSRVICNMYVKLTNMFL